MGHYLCQEFRRHYFKMEDVEAREALLEAWIDIVLRMKAEGDLEPIHIGLYQGDPLCGSLLDDKELVRRLGLSQEQVAAHLYNAWECGYDIEDTLYEVRKQKKDEFTEGYLLRCNRIRTQARQEAQERLKHLDYWKLLSEPQEKRLQLANALRYDPEVNYGDEDRIEAGWLTVLNHHYQAGVDCLEEALRYANRFFDYPEAFVNAI